ncbi:MAG: YidC/Oxa1 family membrane protein insertase [Streptococcaceae bacterium]|jgi:YidC/Oxa1 family membrane protein insertase|nr:YidC/Oxa1 family membrane protein insertase [Streptococcaceae bacterium]
MKKKKFKRISLAGLAFSALLVLSACTQKGVTGKSTGLWNQIVFGFAQIIHWLSFGGSIGLGIILITLIIRAALMPLMNLQIKSSQKTQELQPQIKALQAQFPGKDMESRRQLQDATQKLYAENKVNPYAGCFPVLLQMPFLWALYQALVNVDFVKIWNVPTKFFWLDLTVKDTTFVLPILAAVFTFLSSYLMMKSAPERNSMTLGMTIAMPFFIFFMAMNFSAGVSLYWVISNAFQVFQTMVIANPWKIIAARDAKQQAVIDKEKARERALKKAKKK